MDNPWVQLSTSSSVELSARQFDRSSSFSAFAESMDEDSSSSDSEQAVSCSGWSTAAVEPFEVEEQATELKFLRVSLSKKERECEHLRQIIKELSHSRSRAHKVKVDLEEQFAALQREFYRVVKVSQLARDASQQAVSRAATLRGDLGAAQDQLRRSRRRASAAEARARSLQEENEQLKSRLAQLQELRGPDDGRTSACARELLYSHAISHLY